MVSVSTLSEWPARWEEVEEQVVGRNPVVKRTILSSMKTGRGRRGLLQI
jgi:hypothetical protein